MLLDRKKLVETSYFFIADIVEGLDTSLAYARGGFIPNLKNLEDLEGKHSQEQTQLGGYGTSDIWEEEWTKFWESNPFKILGGRDTMRNEPFEERLQTALEENKKLDAFKSKVRRKENEESFLRPEEAFRGYKPIHFYRFKIPEIDLENTAPFERDEDNFPFSQQIFDSEATLEYEIIAEEDLGFELYQWLYEMELNQLVSFTFSIHGFYTNLKNYYEQNKGLSFPNTYRKS